MCARVPNAERLADLAGVSCQGPHRCERGGPGQAGQGPRSFAPGGPGLECEGPLRRGQGGPRGEGPLRRVQGGPRTLALPGSPTPQGKVDLACVSFPAYATLWCACAAALLPLAAAGLTDGRLGRSRAGLGGRRTPADRRATRHSQNTCPPGGRAGRSVPVSHCWIEQSEAVWW